MIHIFSSVFDIASCSLYLDDSHEETDDSITVEITAIGKDSEGKVRTYSVNDIVDNKVYIYTDSKDEVYNYFYIVNGERKDIDKLEVEIDK